MPRRTEEIKKELTKWQKMFMPGQDWVKDDLFDVVGGVKQVIALFIGIVWGLIPVLGSSGIITFGILTVSISFVYYTRFLQVDDEDFGRFELIQEGMFPAFAIFLLSWVITYNAIYV